MTAAKLLMAPLVVVMSDASKPVTSWLNAIEMAAELDFVGFGSVDVMVVVGGLRSMMRPVALVAVAEFPALSVAVAVTG